jgi:uncharacterized protein
MKPLHFHHLLTAEQSRLLERLCERLQDVQPGLIAVSGGLDSRFLAHIAHCQGLDFRALLFTTPLVSLEERQTAEATVRRMGMPFTAVALNPLQCAEVARNERERCYHCKRFLFSRAHELAAYWGGGHILDGTQADDLEEHRPGLAALGELSIKSPLAEIGLSKAALRQLARAVGVDRPDQPSRPCLLTRFAYGYAPSEEELAHVGAAEEALLRQGLGPLRVRVLRGGKACLQLAASSPTLDPAQKASVSQTLRAHGLSPFELITTDSLSGFFDGACRTLHAEPQGAETQALAPGDPCER